MIKPISNLPNSVFGNDLNTCYVNRIKHVWHLRNGPVLTFIFKTPVCNLQMCVFYVV